MRKFKILVIGHQLKNNIIAKCNDIVDESQLNGNAMELVKAGFVKEVVFEPEKEIQVVDEINLDKMSKADLISFANLNGFIVTETSSKKDILSEIDAQIKEKEVSGEIVTE